MHGLLKTQGFFPKTQGNFFQKLKQIFVKTQGKIVKTQPTGNSKNNLYLSNSQALTVCSINSKEYLTITPKTQEIWTQNQENCVNTENVIKTQ